MEIVYRDRTDIRVRLDGPAEMKVGDRLSRNGDLVTSVTERGEDYLVTTRHSEHPVARDTELMVWRTAAAV